MPTTVQEVLEFIAPFTGENGICVSEETTPLLIGELNSAIRLLIKRMDAKGTLLNWKVKLRSQEFTLPYDCLESRQMWLGNQSLIQRDQFYQGQFGSGIKCAGPWMCQQHELIDIGDEYPLPYDWPNHFDTRYGLVSESNADAGKQVTVRLINTHGDTVQEQITLLPDQQCAVTQNAISQIVFQSKGQTNGAVRGYIVYPQIGNQQVWIGTFPSFVSIPRYRRKKLPHCFPCGNEGILTILGKIRYFNVQNVTDEIPISDEFALGYACKALQAMRNSRFDEMNTALSLALNELDRQNQDEASRAVVTPMQLAAPWSPRVFNHSMGWR